MNQIRYTKKDFLLLWIFIVLFVIPIFAQNITGVLVNNSGLPIKNALICHTNNTSLYTKTDDNGAFSINGNVGTQLRIGALKYDTIDAYTATSTNGITITMADDPLLATDVFHISFDHLRPGPTYTKQELKDDFNLAYAKGFYEGTADTDRATVDYTESRDVGGVSLKVRFPQGKLKTEDSGIDTRIDLAGTFNSNNYQSEDLYVSYWVKFSSNFEFNKCGGKLPSLGGSTYNSTQDRWKGRIMWRKGGSIQFYMELPDNSFTPTNDERFWGQQVTPGSDICVFEYEPYLNQPGWHNIELHYKFETPGMNDGLFEGWVDGVNYDFMNASVFNNYRPVGTSRENITINAILLSAFLGGTDTTDYAPSQDTFAWFDEFRVATQRINEYNTYTLATASFDPIAAIAIYPNPSSDYLNISLPTTATIKAQIKDVTGKEITTMIIPSSSTETSKKIDISNLETGLYYVTLAFDGISTTKKFIVK